jgi:endogenous inhibitor of DNA gyrase (YacG/DUF329 family)
VTPARGGRVRFSVTRLARPSYLYDVPARLACPTCRRALPGELPRAELPFYPFCSERCRGADLGSWLNGNYRISAPVGEDEDLDDGDAGRLRLTPDDEN